MSAVKSTDANSRRKISAPYLEMISSGEMTLPSDFDIFFVASSRMSPCVSTLRYGAASLVATAVISDTWNQPRC